MTASRHAPLPQQEALRQIQRMSLQSPLPGIADSLTGLHATQSTKWTIAIEDFVALRVISCAVSFELGGILILSGDDRLKCKLVTPLPSIAVQCRSL